MITSFYTDQGFTLDPKDSVAFFECSLSIELCSYFVSLFEALRTRVETVIPDLTPIRSNPSLGQSTNPSIADNIFPEPIPVRYNAIPPELLELMGVAFGVEQKQIQNKLKFQLYHHQAYTQTLTRCSAAGPTLNFVVDGDELHINTMDDTGKCISHTAERGEAFLLNSAGWYNTLVSTGKTRLFLSVKNKDWSLNPRSFEEVTKEVASKMELNLNWRNIQAIW